MRATLSELKGNILPDTLLPDIQYSVIVLYSGIAVRFSTNDHSLSTDPIVPYIHSSPNFDFSISISFSNNICNDSPDNLPKPQIFHINALYRNLLPENQMYPDESENNFPLLQFAQFLLIILSPTPVFYIAHQSIEYLCK